jgi:hypothetical protein
MNRMFNIHYDSILNKMNFYFNTIGIFFLFLLEWNSDGA